MPVLQEMNRMDNNWEMTCVGTPVRNTEEQMAALSAQITERGP